MSDLEAWKPVSYVHPLWQRGHQGACPVFRTELEGALTSCAFLGLQLQTGFVPVRAADAVS